MGLVLYWTLEIWWCRICHNWLQSIMMCYCKRIQLKEEEEEEEARRLIAKRRALLQLSKLALVHGLVWFVPALTVVAAAAATTTLLFFFCAEIVTLRFWGNFYAVFVIKSFGMISNANPKINLVQQHKHTHICIKACVYIYLRLMKIREHWLLNYVQYSRKRFLIRKQNRLGSQPQPGLSQWEKFLLEFNLNIEFFFISNFELIKRFVFQVLLP